MSIKKTDYSEEVEELRKLVHGLNTRAEYLHAFTEYALANHNIVDLNSSEASHYTNELRKHPAMNAILDFMEV